VQPNERKDRSGLSDGSVVAVSDRCVTKPRLSVLSVTATSVEHELLQVASKKRWKPVWKQRLIVCTLVLSDVFLALVVWGTAYVGQSIWGRGDVSDVAIAAIVPSVMVWVGLRALIGLYPGYGLDSAEKLRRHAYSAFATLAVLAVFAVGFQIGNLLSRLLLAIAFLGLLFMAPFVQHFVKLGMKKAKLWGKPVIILSYKETGARFQELLKQEWGIGYDPVARLDHHLVAAGKSYLEGSYEENLTNAANLGRELGVDTVIFAMPYTRREKLARMVSVASESFRSVLIVPNLNGVTNSAVVARDIAGTFAVEIKQNLLDPWSQRLKRALDLVGTVIGGSLVSPLLFAIAVLIKLDSPGPALFIQERPGLNGRAFRVLKFRTMHAGAEQRFDELVLKDPRLKQEFEEYGKLRNDPRVTRIGRFLRRSSLDELPQLWNVLKGEMSLVGPRAYLLNQIPQLHSNTATVLRVPPGISGLWQVSGRSETTFEQRVEMDIYYVRNWSVWLDLVILARTVKNVVLSKGAF
jgi:Undecaprenyl-phosphate galactose phosphotransferase WbaP